MPATANRTIPPIDDAPSASAATIATGATTNARRARSRLPMFLTRNLLAIAGSFRDRVAVDWKDEVGGPGGTPPRHNQESCAADRSRSLPCSSGEGSGGRP